MENRGEFPSSSLGKNFPFERCFLKNSWTENKPNRYSRSIYRPAIFRLPTEFWLTIEHYTDQVSDQGLRTKCRPLTECRSAIDRYSVNCRRGMTGIGELKADIHIDRYIDRLSTEYRSTVDRQSVDCQPTVDRYTHKLIISMIIGRTARLQLCI